MGWQWHKDMVAKPPTSVQEGVTTFARKPQDISNEMSWQFPDENQIFLIMYTKM